jgi:hypothetical protein
VQGKLYILGGGWSITGPQPQPSAIAIKIDVPWSEANRKHRLNVELVDSDYNPILVPTPAGNAPLKIGCEFEVGRPPGIIPGTPIDVPLAFSLGPIPLEAGKRYLWKLSIDDKSDPDWEVGFRTREVAKKPVQA